MLLNNTRSDITMQGMAIQKAMTIKASPEMFDLLAKQLYPEPIKAIVREIAFGNTIDASEEGGTVEIALPTMISPEFKVRDHGCGMSQEFVLNNYSTFGDSFKNQSNEYIGAMGVGSKSGFAYQDSFSITSYHEGTKSAYVVTRGADGIPQVNLIGSWPTNETGLEFSIAVNQYDFNRFDKWVKYFLSYYKVQPYKNIDFKVNMTAEPVKLGRELHTDKLYLAGSPELTSIVLMGGIAYACKFRSKLYNSYIVYKAAIGEFAVTASRDEIRASDTDAVFEEYLELKETDSIAELVDKFNSCCTAVDKFESIKDLPTSIAGKIWQDNKPDVIGCSNAKWEVCFGYRKTLSLEVKNFDTVVWDGYRRSNNNRWYTNLYISNTYYYIPEESTRVPSTLKWNHVGSCVIINSPVLKKILVDNGFEVLDFSDLEKPTISRTTIATTSTKKSDDPVMCQYRLVSGGAARWCEMDRKDIIKKANIFKVYTETRRYVQGSVPVFDKLDKVIYYLNKHHADKNYYLVNVNKVQTKWYDKNVKHSVEELYRDLLVEAKSYLVSNLWNRYQLYRFNKEVDGPLSYVYRLMNSIDWDTNQQLESAYNLVLSDNHQWQYPTPKDLPAYKTFENSIKKHKWYPLLDLSGTASEHLKLLKALDMI